MTPTKVTKAAKLKPMMFMREGDLYVEHDRRLSISTHALGELTEQRRRQMGNYALDLMPDEAAKLPGIEELMSTWYERAFS